MFSWEERNSYVKRCHDSDPTMYTSLAHLVYCVGNVQETSNSKWWLTYHSSSTWLCGHNETAILSWCLIKPRKRAKASLPWVAASFRISAMLSRTTCFRSQAVQNLTEIAFCDENVQSHRVSCVKSPQCKPWWHLKSRNGLSMTCMWVLQKWVYHNWRRALQVNVIQLPLTRKRGYSDLMMEIMLCAIGIFGCL